MTTPRFPKLEPSEIGETRDALHAYGRVLGAWLKSIRTKRRHWWHASLRPSIKGLTTGVVRADIDFELELDFVSSELRVVTDESVTAEKLAGQAAGDIAAFLVDSLATIGVDVSCVPDVEYGSGGGFPGYDAAAAKKLHRAFASVAAALEAFRAGIREETSPIQIWPHHFDLSMIWLPGVKVRDEDPTDEELSDKQMNFGFVFGDDSIKRPYFYVTAYPLPNAFPTIALPARTTWRTDPFSGAVLLYEDLVAMDDPASYLKGLWSVLLAAGRKHLAIDK